MIQCNLINQIPDTRGTIIHTKKNCGTSRTSTTPTRNLQFFVLFVKEYPRQHRRHVCQFVIVVLQ